MLIRTPFFAFPMAVLAACGGVAPEFDTDLGEEEEEARIAYDYTCTGLNGDDSLGNATVSLRSSAMTVTLPTKGWVLTGAYDASYTPRSAANQNKVRYNGFPRACNAAGTCSTLSELLIDRSMRSGGIALRTGGKGGFAKFRFKLDTFAEVSTICRITTVTTGGGTSTGGSKAVEGVKFTAAEIASTLRAANEATSAQLKGAKLTARVVTNILNGREFDSIESLAGVAYVGKTALTNLKALAKASFSGGSTGGAPTGAATVASLNGVVNGLGRWHESGDNGVDTRVLHLAGADSLQAAIAELGRQVATGSVVNALEGEGRTAIETFQSQATDDLEQWRATFYDGENAPAEDENTEAMAAFASKVAEVFGTLSEVRAARGSDHDGYLLGRVSDGFVAVVVWPYRDGGW